MDEQGQVIYVGSYSKVIAPGIRVGFVCAPRELIAKLVVGKQISDVHTNQFFMILVQRLLAEGKLDRHIENARAIYLKKRDHMLAALERELSGKATWTRPDGGLFIWLNLSGGRDSAPLCRCLASNKVAVVPGSAFMADENETCCGMRLNFSLPTFEQIDQGIKTIARYIDEV